ncbi:MAG: hypothetical protein ABFE07_04915 [Armatimonadia bacterium]
MAKQKKATVDGGISFYKIEGSRVWHVQNIHHSPYTLCGQNMMDTVGDDTLAIPEGERICSNCLRKLDNALGTAYETIRVGK